MWNSRYKVWEDKEEGEEGEDGKDVVWAGVDIEEVFAIVVGDWNLADKEEVSINVDDNDDDEVAEISVLSLVLLLFLAIVVDRLVQVDVVLVDVTLKTRTRPLENPNRRYSSDTQEHVTSKIEGDESR